jgi:threonine synthase
LKIKETYCLNCRTRLKSRKIFYKCENCGEVVDIIYDYDEIKKSIPKNFSQIPINHWKYSLFYPFEKSLVSLGEGNTPLIFSEKLSKSLNSKVFLKYEGTNPTGSFKDRGSTLEISFAKFLNVENVVVASTGNMGASLAAYSAKAGIKCKVFLPKNVSKVKIEQIKSYGAEIEFFGETYTEVFNYVEKIHDKKYFLTGDYPIRCEGEKSVGFEIAEQLKFNSPDFIVSPVGNGTLIYSTWKAFKELKEVKLIKKLPRLIAVQAFGCNPIVRAWNKGLEKVEPIEKAKTLATAIACENPVYGNYALKAIRESNGLAVDVSDKEMKIAKGILGKEGIYAELSASASLAGIIKLKREIFGNVVCLITGHGFKDLSLVFN